MTQALMVAGMFRMFFLGSLYLQRVLRYHAMQIGLAVLATLSTARTDRLLAEGESLASALAGGYHLAFGIAAGLVLGVMVVAATVLGAEPTTRLVRVVEDDFAERRVA